MKLIELEQNIPKDFTGICRVDAYKRICYYKNGKLHREDGAAIIYDDGTKYWMLNGLQHRESGSAYEDFKYHKKWWYKGNLYGYDYDFTNISWIEHIQKLKREEEFKIFK